MRMLRDFHCNGCGKDIEKYIETDVLQIDCECGSTAYRMIGMPSIALDGTDSSFPGAYDKWARIREDRAKDNARRSN